MRNALSCVLLIEDNPGDARLVREHLRDRFGDGCEVHDAASLADGLRWLAGRRADVILLDLSLPDSQGLNTFYAVNAHAPGTPIVILSGLDDDELALDAVRAGAEDYLAKQHADGVALARSLRHAVERRKVERGLRDSEAQYRTIVETADEGVLQIDAQRRVRFANNRVAKLLARPASQMLGQPFEDLVDPDYADAVVTFLSSCAAGGPKRTMQLPFQCPDGSDVWTLMSAAAVHAFGADSLDIVIMLSDITGRLHAERELVRMASDLEARVADRTAQLEAANAELAHFNNAIAHDLKTPLNAIVGIASLLEQDPALAQSPRAREQLEMVQQGALDMGDLVSAMLALSQIGRAQFRREPLDLSAMAVAVVRQLHAAEPGRSVRIDIEPGLQATGDPALVRDVMLNLLGNAWKYSRRAEKPWIRFGLASRDARETVFVVQDNGVGFEMAMADKLFQPFQRLPSSEGFEGTGVGLATVRRIVERHEGRVWAESLPGVGTSLFFTLAAAQ